MPNETAAATLPNAGSQTEEKLSPWWRRASLLTMAFGFAVLILLTTKAYQDAPPIPDQVTGPDGSVLYTAADIRAGQQVFLKYGLMDNGSIWGHGALLGPNFSAEYLQTLALHSTASIARKRYHLPLDQLVIPIL